MKRQWSTFDGEVLLQHLYTIASVPRHASCGGLGQRLCPRPRGSDDALGQWLSAFQDDPTTQRCGVAAKRAAENVSRCGEEAKRRTQLGKKPRMSSVPAGRLRWAWRAWVRKHPSKECFVESDMTSEAAHSCWATRGHTSAYRDAERLGRPATESGKHGTTASSVEDACSQVPRDEDTRFEDLAAILVAPWSLCSPRQMG